jgi:hypothetical protein
MKQENRIDPLAKSPDPDDLSSEQPPKPSSHTSNGSVAKEQRPNPDVSEPHVPPPDDHPLRRRPARPESA